MFGWFSKQKNATGEPAAPLNAPQNAGQVHPHIPELLSVAYVSLADGELSQKEMEALYELSSNMTRPPEVGVQVLLSFHKLVADGGETACAYQFKNWGAREFPMEQKRGILLAGLYFTMVDGPTSQAEFNAVEKVSQWLAMTPAEFAACVRSAVDGSDKPAKRP